jgi:IS1 family transposase
VVNRLPIERKAKVIAAMVEGVGVNAISRMVGVSKGAILKLLADVGRACAEYQDRTFRNLTCKRLQADECWQFCYAKAKNVPANKQGQFGVGDVWTWTAIDADTKLVPSFLVGNRDAHSARLFINDLADRLKNRIQLTTDGFKVYVNAVESAFAGEIDYAMLRKIYGSSQEETRYSPAECIGCERRPIEGNPDPAHISTSYVERLNLTMRMHMRRFTRLTNGHSKKIENHIYAVALNFMYYNFAKVHQTLKVTPAMEAGLTDHVWTIEEMLSTINA